MTDEDWEQLAERLDRFADAWRDSDEPPHLIPFVDGASSVLGAQLLPELIKMDVEQRMAAGLDVDYDTYAEAFPELVWHQGPPAALLIDGLMGVPVGERAAALEDLQVRYPARAYDLARLGGLVATQAEEVPIPWPNEGDTLDDFLVLQQVGAGSFARVYLARQVSMHRTVALKVSRQQGDEAATLAQLDHPHIVRVFDQRDIERPALRLLYMEVVAGGSLQAYIEASRLGEGGGATLLACIDRHAGELGVDIPRDSRLRDALRRMDRYEVACLLGAHLAEGLAHAHAQGVLHRDVKPANVLLGVDGRAKLADFNIGYASGLEGADPARALGGTLAYMAPEQMQAIHPGHATTAEALDTGIDVYALGVVIFEVAEGRRPIADEPRGGGVEEGLDAMIAARQGAEHAKASGSLVPTAPWGFAALLRDALEPGPSRRPPARRMARNLRLLLDPGVVGLARSTGPGLVAWARAHPRFFLLALAVLPNLLLSALNVAYNLDTLIDRTGVATFKTQVMVVNAVAFGVGILALVLWLRPFRWHGATGEPYRLRRLTHLGHFLVGVTLPLWILGGLAFPVWQHAESGTPNAEAYLHFAVSNTLFGFLAASAGYLLVTWAAQRAFLARELLTRLRHHDGPEGLRRDLVQQGRGARLALLVFMAVPSLAIVFLALSASSPNRAAFLALGLLGITFLWPMVTLASGAPERAARLARIVEAPTPPEEQP